MQTELEQVKNQEACTDDCCQDPPGFARAYAIGIGALFGIIILALLVNALIN
ncbi:MAG: hypothetical protein H0W21_07930 [Actinobacteria bacterium]|nr:hypothetical protein [Actinomycetota bacterium]